MRKSHTPSFKVEAAIALLQEDKPLSRIASEMGVSPSLVSRWKATAIENMKNLFADDERSDEALRAVHKRNAKSHMQRLEGSTSSYSGLKRARINRVQG